MAARSATSDLGYLAPRPPAAVRMAGPGMRAGIASHNAASSQQSAPVTLGGVAKSYGSGALGALIGLSHQVNPLDPHGWADNAELATTMGAWALKRAGIITPQQMTGAINAEHDFRRRIPLRLADTSEEQQRASGYYHDPRNRAEEIANIAGGATVAAIGGPETLAANAARTALRTGAQVVFKTAARQTARVARQVAAQTALQEAARVVVQRAGGDAYDQQAATMAAGFVPTSRKASAAPTPEPQPARAPTATRGQVSPTILQTAAPGAPPTPQARPVLGPASNVRRPPSELTRLGPATVLATARERPSSLATTASGFVAFSARRWTLALRPHRNRPLAIFNQVPQAAARNRQHRSTQYAQRLAMMTLARQLHRSRSERVTSPGSVQSPTALGKSGSPRAPLLRLARPTTRLEASTNSAIPWWRLRRQAGPRLRRHPQRFRPRHTQSLRKNNDDLEIGQYVPGVVIFGTNGGTEYFSFNFGTSLPSFVTIPAALDPEYVAPIARTFAGFLQALEQGWEVGDSPSPD